MSGAAPRPPPWVQPLPLTKSGFRPRSDHVLSRPIEAPGHRFHVSQSIPNPLGAGG